MKDLASNTRLREERRFLQAEVFAGLKDLNTGFDSPLISHFSAFDFLEVIDRCERLGVQIIGIETFSPDVELLDIEIAPGPSLGWARRFVQKFPTDADVTFCATYDVDQRGKAGASSSRQ